MLLHCPKVQAQFPGEKICLENKGPAWMHWTEHGGTLILKIGDLKFTEISTPGEKSGFFLEVELSSRENLVREIEGFAAEQSLTLPPPGLTPTSECLIHPILAACHIPEQLKFIFAEDSQLAARPGKAGAVEIAVQGEFRARAVPCREADLVIHLTPGDMVEFLSCLRAWIIGKGNRGLA